MGYSCGWFAAKGISTREMLALLDMSLESATWSATDPDAQVLAARLESGWLVIQFRDDWLGAGDEGRLEKLSSHAELVVSCVLSETSMTSQAKGFRAGEKIWDIWHSPMEGLTHLEVEGTPPECLSGIEQQKLARLLSYRRQGEVGVDTLFDVPIDVCEALTGFRHDKECFTDPYLALHDAYYDLRRHHHDDGDE